MRKRRIDQVLADRQVSADLKEITFQAAYGTNLTLDRVIASLGNATTYRMPTESFAVENALREKLLRLPSDVRAEMVSAATARLNAPTGERKKYYGDFANVPIAGNTESTAILLRDVLPSELKAVRERLRLKMHDRTLAQFQPASLSAPLHLVRDKLEQQLEARARNGKRQDKAASGEKKVSKRTLAKGSKEDTKTTAGIADAFKNLEMRAGIKDKLQNLDLEPPLKLKVPSEIELRLKKVTCNRPTRNRGKDDIFLAARLTDYYNGNDVYTQPFKIDNLNDKHPIKEYTTPVSLGKIAVADNLVFDSIFDATIYFAECDLGPRDFEKYCEGTGSVNGHEFKELVVATIVSTAIAFLAEDRQSLKQLVEDEPLLLMIGGGGLLSSTGLGLLPPKWLFVINGVIGIIPALAFGIVFSVRDGIRRLIKDEIFPENIAHLHIPGPILVAAEKDQTKFPARIQNFELRKQRQIPPLVVALKDRDITNITTADLFDEADPDVIASYTVELEWVIHTSDEEIPVNDLEPAQPLTDEDEALTRLDEQIDHIIVIMMENRSFDHMLGFLEHDRGRKDLDPTVTPELPNGLPRVNRLGEVDFVPFPLDKTRFPFDPSHNVEQVGRQMWGQLFWDGQPEKDLIPPIPGWVDAHVFAAPRDIETDDLIDLPEEQPSEPMSGFVAAFAKVINGVRSAVDPGNRVDLSDPNSPDFEKDKEDVRQIMGYHPAENVPYYDFLATEFGVCSKWFCAMPGNTWVNRAITYTGQPAKFKRESNEEDVRLVADNAFPLDEVSFVRELQRRGKNWAWYAQDMPSLLVVDLELADHIERGNIRSIDRFFKDLEKPEKFPEVAWIDPNFMDIGDMGTNLRGILRRLTTDVGRSDGISNEVVELNTANSDQPPADVMHGQVFLQTIIEKLMDSPVWNKSLVIITYDEHGGFYDHVPPERIDPALQPELGPLNPFHWRGPRVPAFVVSPHVGRQLVFSQAPADANGVRKVVDHLSIQKTIFQRFCKNDDGTVDFLTPRVAAAEHLGWVLSGPNLRFPPVQATSLAATRRKRLFNRALRSVMLAQLEADRMRTKRRGTPKPSEFQSTYLSKLQHIAARLEDHPASTKPKRTRQ